jgi:hypothetical protein
MEWMSGGAKRQCDRAHPHLQQQPQHLQLAVQRRGHQRRAAVAVRAVRFRAAWPRAGLSLSTDIHLSVLNNSYDRMYL